MTKEPRPEVSPSDIDAVAALQHAIFLHLQDVGEDRDSFFAWMRSMLKELRLFDEGGQNHEQFAYWFARQFWNAIPLESNGFRPSPLPPPKSDEPCPCGSGDLFRMCCEPWVPLDELPENVLWPALVQSRPHEYWIAASRKGRLPPAGIVHAADFLFEAGLWEDIVDLAEPSFMPGRGIDEALADVIPLLCEAYDALNDTPQHKEELLRRLVRDRGAPIRCVANQHLASWLHDQGQRDEAWRTIEAAERDVPGEPMTALIELTMLCAERRFDRIPDRAAYWLRSVGRNPLAPEQALTSIRTFRDDPKRGRDEYYRLTLPDDANDLLDWIDEHIDRRHPTLRWRRVRNEAQDENLLGAHLPLVPAKSRALERRWGKLSGIDKPFSTDPLSGTESDGWEDIDDWLPWLDANREALDSLSILDDIVRLLVWLEPELGAEDSRWTMALLARAAAVLAKGWPPTKKGTLPWLFEENRPALRLLWLYIERIRDDSPVRLERFERLYLRLNPNDNHGIRAPMVNRLLAEGRDTDALAIAERYPGDMHVELPYGRVLALYRLGRLDEAAAALEDARRDLPLVPEYLLRQRVNAPELDEFRVQIGGEDQAWLYREAMRGVWMATDGMRPWLAGK
ncbi:MAG: SEC-C domain-containing protein [Gammaproteobacteria bacterium]|nr:SEC-C domain-containing protein [Gammaproteobacteria bacterium]